MSTSFLLLAACITGGLPDSGPVTPVPAPMVSGSGCSSCSSCGQECAPSCERHGLLARLFSGRFRTCESSCDTCYRPRFLERIRNLFGKRNCSSCCTASCNTCASPCATVYTPPPVLTPVVDVVKPARNSSEISKEYLPRVGHDADYRHITGQLAYVHADKGLGVVRYAPVDREDRYGGSVVLSPVINMDTYRDGDLVTISGEILNDGRATRYLGGPAYRAQTMLLEDRPK
ncbi:hypothetical protein BH10PLA2_BH10PLA2_09920 [soil metagenome]